IAMINVCLHTLCVSLIIKILAIYCVCLCVGVCLSLSMRVSVCVCVCVCVCVYINKGTMDCFNHLIIACGGGCVGEYEHQHQVKKRHLRHTHRDRLHI